MLLSTRLEIEAILAVMNTNELVAEKGLKKFLFRPFFSTAVHIYDFHIFTVIIN